VQIGRGWRAQRAAFDFACAAQSPEKLHGRKTVRADRRLRTDDEAIRAQSTIFE
jgi:hypothetical protein